MRCQAIFWRSVDQTSCHCEIEQPHVEHRCHCGISWKDEWARIPLTTHAVEDCFIEGHKVTLEFDTNDSGNWGFDVARARSAAGPKSSPDSIAQAIFSHMPHVCSIEIQSPIFNTRFRVSR